MKNLIMNSIIKLIVVELFILGQVAPLGGPAGLAYAANDSFVQTNWQAGTSSDSAVHPTNKSGWTKYTSKDTYIDTSAAGKITMSTEALSVTDTTNADFQRAGSTRAKLDAANDSLTLQSTSEDVFVDNLGKWTTQPEVPRLDYWSAYVRILDPRDSKLYIYTLWTGRTFGRFSVENETWEILANMPRSTGFGAALAYPSGGGDFIYATRGGGSKEFYKYSITNDTWTKLASLPYSVAAGGSLAAYDANSIYCVPGGSTNKFLCYTITTPADTWTDLTDTYPTPNTVTRQGGLVYPGTGVYIYLAYNFTNTGFARYKVTSPSSWTTLTASPTGCGLGDLCYPGTGDYIYAWYTDDYRRSFARYNFVSPGWTDLSATARVPTHTLRGILYYPGSGTKLKLLMAQNYTKPLNFDTSTLKWDEPSAPLIGTSTGSDMAYDGTNIYYTRGGAYTPFNRYNPATDVHETRDSLPYNVYTGGALAYSANNNAIYAVPATYNTSTRYFLKFDMTSQTWTNLTSTQPTPALVNNYGFSMCAAGNYLYALHGNNNAKFWRYDTTNGWQDDEAVALDAPATAGSGAAMAYPGVADDSGNYFIYAARGNDTQTFWKYCTSTTGTPAVNTWTQIANLPVRADYKGKLMYPGTGDYIYFINGRASLFFRYKFKGGSGVDVWEYLEPAPFPLVYEHAACAIGTKIYAGAGSSDRCMYVYDTAAGTWSSRYTNNFAMPYAIYYNAAPFYPYYGSMVYVGGNDVYMIYGNYSSHVFKYDLAQKRWTGVYKAKSAAGDIIFGPGTKACYPGSGDYIYVIEGRNTNRFWKYKFKGTAPINTWTALTGPTVSGSPLRFYLGSQIDGSGDTLYACQGQDLTAASYDQSNKFLVYTISTDSWQVSDGVNLLNLPGYGVRNYSYLGNRMVLVPALNKLYFVGSEDSTMRIYDTATKLWSQAATPPSGMSIYNASETCLQYRSTDNSIYLYNGGGGSGPYKLYKYALTGGTWSALSLHNRCGSSNNGRGDADAFYPASGGDFIYFMDGIYYYLNRYSISTNDWDQPATADYAYATYQPYNYNDPGAMCEGPDGDSLYYGAYGGPYFSRYNFSTRAWTTLQTPTGGGLSWRWDSTGSASMVYFPGDKNSIFTSRGNSSTNFGKYSISNNTWTECLSPGTWGAGHNLVATNYKIYALLGGGTTSFQSYDPALPNNAWIAEQSFPVTVSDGAGMCYVGANNTIYALRGVNTPSFYKFTVANPAWTQLPNAPVLLGGTGPSSLVYPLKGDYIYLIPGSIYSYIGDTSSMYRFSISSEQWDTTEMESAPVGFRSLSKAFYPGQGNYLYVYRGYGFGDFLKYNLFKEGLYTSEIKNIGRNKAYGTITWNSNSKGSLEFRARTSEKADMSDATSWVLAPVRQKGDLLSDSYPTVNNRDYYFQYQMKFIADDLTNCPALNDLTINYEKYRTRQELVSSAYDSTETNNRLMKLSWSETQPSGVDVRFQIKTAATKAGLDDENNHFLGPGGTQTFDNDYLTAGDYAYTPTAIEVTGGCANLKKILQDYQFTQRIVINNSAGSTSYVNTAVLITIDSSNNHFWANVKSDGADVRFADQTGNNIPYNISGGLAVWNYSGKSAKILVKLGSIPAGQKTSIYLKYGKADAVSASDPVNVIGLKVCNVAAYEASDASDYAGATGVIAYMTGLVLDSIVSGYAGGWNAAILTKSYASGAETAVIFLTGRTSAEVITALNNSKIVVLGSTAYNALKAYLGITSDRTYTARGLSVQYFAYSNGFVLGSMESSSLGCEWEEQSATYMQNRGLTFREAIVNLPGAGAVGSDIYLGALELPTIFTSYMDKTTTPSLSGWEYRNEIELDNTLGPTLTNYQIKVNLTSGFEDFWTRCLSTGYDVRFVDSDNTTILNYYRISWDYANKTASFWVKIPSLAAGQVKRIYLYYAKSGAADASNFTDTMTKDFSELGANTSAAALDGVDDKVTVANSGSLNITGNVTLEANVKYTPDYWPAGWQYRKRLTFNNTGNPKYTNITARFDVAYIAGMNNDFSDLRFWTTDHSQRLRYKINSSTPGVTAEILVIIPEIAANASQDIYMYYGNAGASSEGDATIQGPAAYTNTGGTGDRGNIIAVTSNAFSTGSPAVLVNGVLSENTLSYKNASVVGAYVTFDFGAGSSKVITEAKHYQQNAVSHDTWQWQGSQDGSSWTNIGSAFTLGGSATQTITALSANNTAYRYYRMSGVTGASSSNPWVYEMEFKIGAVVNFTPTLGSQETEPATPKWLPGFGYRKRITLDNTSGPALTNRAHQFDVAYVADKMSATYADIRFVDTNGAKLSYRILSYDGTKATVLVKLPTIPAASKKDIYLYYGNASAVSESDAAVQGGYTTSGMQAYWNFNEGTGTSAADSSGNNRTGTLINGALWTDGKLNNGKAISIDNINDRVSIASTNFAGLTDYTMAAWVYIKGNHQSYTGSIMSSGNWNTNYWVFGISQNNAQIHMRAGATGPSYNFQTNRWYYIAVTRSGSTGTFYIDGTSIGTVSLGSSALVSTDSNTTIGGATYTSSNFTFNGIIDEPVIYNCALSATEIQNVYAGGANTIGLIFTPTFAAEETQPAINQTIIGKSGAYELKFTTSGLAGLINGVEKVATPMYSAGSFMHAAMSYDGANVKLYVNGVQKSSAALTDAINSNSNDVTIGDNLRGAIDEARIWNIARKVGSILENKEKCLVGTETGLACYLRFNENTGTAAADATTNGNNGALSGGAAWLSPSFAYSNGLSSALYHFDEGSGAPQDGSGNNNTMTLHADVGWSNEDLTGFNNGKSLNFNVANTYGTAADNSSLNITGKITLEAWIKPADILGTKVLLVKGDDTASRWNYKLLQSGDTIAFSIYNGSERILGTSSGTLVAGSTYHIVATYDETTESVNIYVNNVLKYSGVLSYAMITNSDALRIGKDVSTGSTSYKGLLDEVRIYARILTTEEIKRHYERRLLTLVDPGVYNVYVPPTGVPEISAYADNNPTIQPVLGIFYTSKNIMHFHGQSTTPVNTAIRYQVSKDGYWWLWWDDPADDDSNGDGTTGWEPVSGGYSQTNTWQQIDDNLGSFQNLYPEGDFYYRAYMHSEASSYRTPSLENIAITLYNTETYYMDPAGATAINTDHTNADADRWYQYKAILYSEGETTPIVDDVTFEYIKSYVKVLTPNGGEMLNVGSQYNITWESQAVTKTTGLVKLEYSLDGAPYQLIAEHVANTGTYSWTVPQSPTDNALIRITSEDFPVVSDTSDAVFKILSIVITSPNGGEIWEQGKQHAITWLAPGSIPNNVLRIDYSANNGSTWTKIVDPVPNVGTYTWNISQAVSDQALIKIYSTSDATIKDTSNAVLSILPTPDISITAPTGGENWLLGEQHTISWRTNTKQFAAQVVLEYSRDDFSSDVQSIATVSVGTAQGPNNNDDIVGSYNWSIPDAVSTNVKIRVREASIPPGRDTQLAKSKISSAFTISEPTITVTAPTAADVFVVGDTHNITWTTVGTISNNLTLEYSTNGTTYTQIATGESNDGTYAWTLPSGAEGNTVYVRVTDGDRTQISDVSEAFKVLGHAAVEMIQPLAGAQLTIGTSYQIKWKTYGHKLESGQSDYNQISIYYSTNNGTDWTLIAYKTANTGTYTWSSVPDAESSQCLIKVFDELDALVTVTSGQFSIVPPSITLTSPNGGEAWYATGATYNITWTSVGSISSNIKLEYSADNKDTWATIATSLPNTGTYNWPSVADVSSSQVYIRITDASRPVVTDDSDGAFTIMPPIISLDAPNGGQEFAVGTLQNIIWTSAGGDYGAIRSGSLTIQYSIDSGTNWVDIDVNQANDGAYTWSVPDNVSDTCKVRVFDSTRPATCGISAANFKIVLPYINVTAPNGGEQWPIGTQKNITWTSVGTISNNLKIEYSKDNFATSTIIATGEANDGTYAWTIPNDYSLNARVKITDSDRTAIYDTSNSIFAIVNQIIKITAPNGSELWTVGDSENITWENTGSVGNTLEIYYSKDNFISDVNTIESALTPNSGTYAWTIPNDVSATVKVKIVDKDKPVVFDKSDANFTILPVPVITISAPALNDTWRVGTQKTITWSDNGGKISNNLTLAYSTNSGVSWTNIATSVPNTGTYVWTIPDDVSATCKVKVTDATRPTTVSTSELFSIANPSITITSPNGGEYWAVAESAPITWTSEGTISSNLILEYSVDNGVTYETIASGQANDGAYTWTVPNDVSTKAFFKIKDGAREATYDVSNAAFTILAKPILTITAPNGAEVYVLGDAVPITWTWKGLSISNNLVLQASVDNFVSSIQVIDTGVANTGSYNWILTGSAMTGSTVKVRITDGNRTEVTDMSDGYFRIRGGFTVTKPNGGEYWVAKSPQTITWETRGNVPNVKLEYTTNDGSTWTVISASIPNINSYTWVLPDVKSTTVKVRISDPTDPTTNDESNAVFAILYYTVKFNVWDYDTLQHLSDVNVNEPATSWSDTGVNSPITRTEMYPYGTYTTFFTKTNFIDNSVTWSTPKDGNTPYTITAYLENSASAQVTWEAILTYSYSPADDTLTAVGSLQRKGKLVGTNELERADMGVATLTVYEPDGATVRKLLTSPAPSTSGTYSFTYSSTGFEAGKVYPATLSVTYRERPYVSSANIDVGAEKLQYEFFTQTAKKLGESVETIEAAVAGGTAQTRGDIEASRKKLVGDLETTREEIAGDISTSQTAVKSHVTSVLSATEAALKTRVDETKTKVETVMKTEILNTESTVKSGDTLTIRYRTYTALAPTIDVYSASNALKLSGGKMTEIKTTGIYEYALKFDSSWGRGDFTIVCSESTKGTLDALILSVISTDLEAMAGQIAGIMGSTSSISNLKATTEAMTSQFSVLETALGKMSKDLVSQVKEASGSVSAFESVFSQLSNLAAQIKEMAGESSVNLSKLYDVSKDKKDDMVYLKNKTQELKAAMELTSQLVQRANDKPVTQTWYEYK